MKKIFLICLIMILLTVFTSCNQNVDEIAYSLATAAPGGTYYAMGGGLANLITEKVDNVTMTTQTTAGSAENIRLVQSGEADFAFANGSELFWAWNGEEYFENSKCDKIRIITFGWTNAFHFAVLEESGISSPYDFVKKKVGVGPRGSAAEIFAKIYLEHINIYDKMTPVYLPPADQTASLKDGNLDVFGLFSGIPMSALIDISSVRNIEILDLVQIGEETGFSNKYPFYVNFKIPSNTYKGQNDDIYTYANLTYLIVNEDVPEDVVYNIMKSVFSEEGIEYMKSVHKRASELNINSIQKLVNDIDVPLHAGAIKFLEENNIE